MTEIEKVEEFVPTPASEWPKKKPPLELTLPSGGKAKVLKPEISLLLARGQVPARVRAAIAKTSVKALEKDPAAALGDAAPLALDCLVAASFVDPLVTMQRKKDCIYIGDVDDADKAFIIAELNLRM